MIRGQDWVSIGKFLKHIGHLALMVNLRKENKEQKTIEYFQLLYDIIRFTILLLY